MTPTPLPTYVPPPTPSGVLGAQAYGDDVVEPVLDQMESAGVMWVRMPVQWSFIEPTKTSPPTYQWTYFDNLFGSLVAEGFTPIGVIYSNPTWAASTTCGPVDLVPLSRFQQFIGDLVERYDGDGSADAPRSPIVDHWEISNEQDFNYDHAGSGESDYGGCFGDDPSAYADHIRAVYLAAQQASPDVRILFGGVAYDRLYNKSGYDPNNRGPFNYYFVGQVLTELYDTYGQEASFPFFDAVAVHVYNDFRNNWDGTQPNNQELIGKVSDFRSNQLYSSGKFDLRSAPLMLTEASLPSMPSDPWTDRSEAIQAAYPGQLATRAMAAGVENVVWFSIEDNFIAPCDAPPWYWHTYGLLRSEAVEQAAKACSPNPLPGYDVDTDHEEKPSHAAFRTAGEQLEDSSYDRQLSTSETGSYQIEAHRFQKSDSSYLLVAFTDHGERLGRKGFSPLSRSMTFDSTILPDWTGHLLVTDHLGGESDYYGTSITLTIEQEPIYVRAE